jgi:hypothetical protein
VNSRDFYVAVLKGLQEFVSIYLSIHVRMHVMLMNVIVTSFLTDPRLKSQ